jgi:spermidine synthase
MAGCPNREFARQVVALQFRDLGGLRSGCHHNFLSANTAKLSKIPKGSVAQRPVRWDWTMPPQAKRSTTKDNGKKASPAPPLPVPVLSRDNGILTLHFESEYVQSQMVLDKPDFLAFAYTRTMMAFDLFLPCPREIALLGLGGGSIAKWCYRHHPKAKLTVVEINPQVIALRDAFKIPEEDQRFQILCEDAAKFVAETANRFDVLLVDCYNGDGIPRDLCSQEFYNHCHQALTESGLIVVNLCVKHHLRILSRLRKSFAGKILLSTDADGNTVVFACKGEMLWPENENKTSFRKKLRNFARNHALGKAMAPRA